MGGADFFFTGARNRRAGSLAVALAALLAVFFLYFFDPTRNHVPLCLFHHFTGWDCPGCGMWRATHCLLHGDFASAWKYNQAWPAYGILAALGFWNSKTGFSAPIPWKGVVIWGCVLWIIAHGLMRNFGK